jgi:hypothetical protein
MRFGPWSTAAWFLPTVAWTVSGDGLGDVFALWFYIDEVSRGVATASTPAGPFTVVHYAVSATCGGVCSAFRTTRFGTTL